MGGQGPRGEETERITITLRPDVSRLLRDLHAIRVGDDPEATITATARTALRRGIVEMMRKRKAGGT